MGAYAPPATKAGAFVYPVRAGGAVFPEASISGARVARLASSSSAVGPSDCRRILPMKTHLTPAKSLLNSN